MSENEKANGIKWDAPPAPEKTWKDGDLRIAPDVVKRKTPPAPVCDECGHATTDHTGYGCAMACPCMVAIVQPGEVPTPPAPERICEYCECAFTPEKTDHHAHAEECLCRLALLEKVAAKDAEVEQLRKVRDRDMERHTEAALEIERLRGIIETYQQAVSGNMEEAKRAWAEVERDARVCPWCHGRAGDFRSGDQGFGEEDIDINRCPETKWEGGKLVAHCHERCKRVKAEAAHLSWKAEAHRLAGERDALKAEVERLRGALERIAHQDIDCGLGKGICDTCNGPTIAREALEGK